MISDRSEFIVGSVLIKFRCVCAIASAPPSASYTRLSRNGDYNPFTLRMSSPGLTSGAQLRYLLQWFGEFSELQKEDFLPIVAAAARGEADQLASILSALNCEDKPVSLFQCRIKLFNEWYPTWSEEEQHRLVKGVTDMDPEFGQKLQDVITNGPQLNGDSGMTNGIYYEEAEVISGSDNSGVTIEIAEENEVPITGEEKVSDNIPVEITAAS